jgi:hypothetical protein
MAFGAAAHCHCLLSLLFPSHLRSRFHSPGFPLNRPPPSHTMGLCHWPNAWRPVGDAAHVENERFSLADREPVLPCEACAERV